MNVRMRRPTEKQLRLGFCRIIDYRVAKPLEWIWVWNHHFNPSYIGLGSCGPVQHFSYHPHNQGQEYWILERTI